MFALALFLAMAAPARLSFADLFDGLLPSNVKSELAGKGYSAAPLLRSSDQAGFFVRGQVPGDQAVHTASDIPISA